DWTLVRGRRHLERVLRTYASHYNRARPHRSLDLATPTSLTPFMPPPRSPWHSGARISWVASFTSTSPWRDGSEYWHPSPYCGWRSPPTAAIEAPMSSPL